MSGMGSKYFTKAPFPYFGGKSKVADAVWKRLGNIRVYNEPFFGSGAVLLSRPHAPYIENINDLDGFVVNFWRAVQAAPDQVAKFSDYPVMEIDLHARHRWLVEQRESMETRLREDPDYYDAKTAGWWVWGACQWIADGWGSCLSRKIPFLNRRGKGILHPEINPYLWMQHLSARLRRVRVTCGDWKRLVQSPSVTTINGLTGVFLDPPYSKAANRKPDVYSKDCLQVGQEVKEWCVANGHNPLIRIALCGYEGEHQMPQDWECFAWKTAGGYSKIGKGKGQENARRERIWFSPYCLKPHLESEKLELL